MATVIEFESLSESLAEKLLNLDTDTIKAYFTNTAPSASLDAVLGDLPSELANGNGYTTGGLTAAVSTSRTGGTTSILLDSNLVLTATGAVGPFRYVAFYSDTSAADNLIAYLDHGSSINMVNTDTYTIGSGTILTIN